MKNIFWLVLKWIIFIILPFGAAYGQTTSVSGVVISSEDGGPIPGVTVVVPSTNNGAITDIDGRFVLQIGPEVTHLAFSYIGYESQTVAIAGRSTINVTLQVSITQLAETVIIGYGTVRKSDLTGSVSSISGEDLTKIPAANAMQALQGKIAGVQVTSPSGDPGAAPRVLIRGVGTLNEAGPLFVVDGIILPRGENINFLNPNDIESMEVLKDASAAAIFGNRASGGVIIITTKQGKFNQDAVINIRTETSVESVHKRLDLLNGREFAQAYNDIFPGTYNNLDILPNIDFQDLIFRDLAPIHSTDVSVSGGSDKMTYYFGGGVFDQQGVIPKSDFRRYSFKLNTTFKAHEKITLGTNILGTHIIKQNAPGVIFSAYGAFPIDNPLDSVGNFLEVRGTSNPLASIEYTNSESRSYQFLSNIFAEYSPIKNLRIKTSFQNDLSFFRARSFTPEFFVSPVQNQEFSTLNMGYGEQVNWIWENTVSYDFESGGHRGNILGGFTVQQESFERPNFAIRNLLRDDPDFWYLNTGLSDSTLVGYGRLQKRSLVSYLFRTNYSYQDKYLVSALVRVDGSSVFNRENRYGVFPSFAVGWNFTNESFFPEIQALDFAKIRASWGRLGNQDINPLGRFSTIGSTQAVFGVDPSLFPGATLAGPGNPDLRWEVTTLWNIGLEMNFLNGRLNVETDYYNRVTDDILVNLSAPGYLGFGAFVQVPFNAASVLNKGFEFNALWQDKAGVIDYKIFANGSTIYNEVLSLGATTQSDSLIRAGSILGNLVTVTTPGHPIGSFTGYNVTGIFQNQEQVDALPSLFGQQPGDFIYEDIDGNGIINADDRTIIGSPIPKFIFGFGFEIGYKLVRLSLDFQGQTGNKIYNGKNQNRFSTFNFEGRVRDRWTTDSPSDTEPRLSSASGNYPPSTYFIEDGSFLRLRTAQLNFDFPQSFRDRLSLGPSSFYLRSTNIFTLTRFTGYSPEVGGSPLASGIDNGLYPITTVYSAGLNISF